MTTWRSGERGRGWGSEDNDRYFSVSEFHSVWALGVSEIATTAASSSSFVDSAFGDRPPCLHPFGSPSLRQAHFLLCLSTSPNIHQHRSILSLTLQSSLPAQILIFGVINIAIYVNNELVH